MLNYLTTRLSDGICVSDLSFLIYLAIYAFALQRLVISSSAR